MGPQSSDLRSDVPPGGVDPTYYTSLTGAAADLKGPLAQQILDELFKIVRGAHFSAGYVGGNSAPALDQPVYEDDIAIEMGAAQAEVSATNIRGARADIKASGESREDLSKKAIEQIRVMAEEAAKLLAKQGEGNAAAWCEAVFGFIGSAVGLLASIIATPLTLGAAAIGVAGAIVGVLMSAAQIANLGVQAGHVTVKGADGKDKALEISIGAAVHAIVEQGVKDGTFSFRDEKHKQDWIMALTIVTTVLVTALQMASGISGMRNAAHLAKDAAQNITSATYKLVNLGANAKLVEKVTNGIGILSDIGEGTGKMASGAVKIQTAEINRDSEKAKAQNAFYAALAKVVSGYLSNQMERLQSNSKSLNDTWDTATSMIADSDASHGRIVRNI